MQDRAIAVSGSRVSAVALHHIIYELILDVRLAMSLAVIASGVSQRLRRLAARQFLVATYEVRSTA
jgi:hypothetical protein